MSLDRSVCTPTLTAKSTNAADRHSVLADDVRHMRAAAVAILALLLCANALPAQEAAIPFMIVHRSPTGKPLARPPFRYMHYYRTEVKNVSDRPLRVVWFEAFHEMKGTWYGGNVLGRVLRGEEFSAWYTEGDRIDHGVIPPGKTAVCDVNWHGQDSPGPMKVKWAFIVVDPSGHDYYAEAVVDPSVIKVVDAKASAKH
jgi:hypothetical protein